MLSYRQSYKRPQPEDIIKLELGVLLPMSIAVGGATGFMPVFDAFVLVGCLSVVFAVLALPIWLGWKFYQRRHGGNDPELPICLPSSDHPRAQQVILISHGFPQLHRVSFETHDTVFLPLTRDIAARREDDEFYRGRFGAPSSAQVSAGDA